MGGSLGEDQVERLSCGETEFYNEKEKRFTSLDLFLLRPPFSLKSQRGLLHQAV